MRSGSWVALGATLGSAAAYLWRLYNEPIDVVVEEVLAPLEPNPDPYFPWHHFTWMYKIPEHWIAEAEARYCNPRISAVGSSVYDSPVLREGVEDTYVSYGHGSFPDNKERVAFSSLPHVGRPLPEGGVLNGPWEASPEEQKYREDLRAWGEKVRSLGSEITGAGLSHVQLREIERGKEPYTLITENLKQRAKALTKARKAAKELEPLLGSPPQPPQ